MVYTIVQILKDNIAMSYIDLGPEKKKPCQTKKKNLTVQNTRFTMKNQRIRKFGLRKTYV